MAAFSLPKQETTVLSRPQDKYTDADTRYCHFHLPVFSLVMQNCSICEHDDEICPDCVVEGVYVL